MKFFSKSSLSVIFLLPALSLSQFITVPNHSPSTIAEANAKANINGAGGSSQASFSGSMNKNEYNVGVQCAGNGSCKSSFVVTQGGRQLLNEVKDVKWTGEILKTKDEGYCLVAVSFCWDRNGAKMDFETAKTNVADQFYFKLGNKDPNYRPPVKGSGSNASTGVSAGGNPVFSPSSPSQGSPTTGALAGGASTGAAGGTAEPLQSSTPGFAGSDNQKASDGTSADGKTTTDEDKTNTTDGTNTTSGEINGAEAVAKITMSFVMSAFIFSALALQMF